MERRGEERRREVRGVEERGVITGSQLNTCLPDSAGIAMSPELTAFMTLFHVLTAHSLKTEELPCARTQTHVSHTRTVHKSNRRVY